MSDFLQFEHDLGYPLPASPYRVGWRAPPWPPPERMGIAVGNTTMIVTVFDPADVGADDLAELRSVATIAVFRRESASSLPDDVDRTHVARGALYRPEDRSRERAGENARSR